MVVGSFEGAEEGGFAEGFIRLPGLLLFLVVEAAAADEGFLKAGGGFEGQTAEGGKGGRRHGAVTTHTTLLTVGGNMDF